MNKLYHKKILALDKNYTIRTGTNQDYYSFLALKTIKSFNDFR